MSIEEDIKTLEKMIEKSRDLREEDFYKLIGIKQIQAIANVLKDREKLKEENKDLKIKVNSKLVGTTAEVKLEEILKNDYISKDKIKENIKDKELQIKCGCENPEDKQHLLGEIFALNELL